MWKKVSVWALAIMSIFTLTFPAIALYVVDTYQIETIQHSIEEDGISALHTGEYYNSLENWQTSDIEDFKDLQYSLGFALIQIGLGVDYDTAFTHIPTNRLHMRNNVTRGGNDNYFLTDDYIIAPVANNVYHWLNITAHELANNVDALIINSTSSHASMSIYIVHGHSTTSTGTDLTEITNTGNDSYVLIIPPSVKTDILAKPEGEVWLHYANINISDIGYSFSVERADTSGLFSISPLILTEIIFLFIVVIMGIFTLFTTDTIDIKIDR